MAEFKCYVACTSCKLPYQILYMYLSTVHVPQLVYSSAIFFVHKMILQLPFSLNGINWLVQKLSVLEFGNYQMQQPVHRDCRVHKSRWGKKQQTWYIWVSFRILCRCRIKTLICYCALMLPKKIGTLSIRFQFCSCSHKNL